MCFVLTCATAAHFEAKAHCVVLENEGALICAADSGVLAAKVLEEHLLHSSCLALARVSTNVEESVFLSLHAPLHKISDQLLLARSSNERVPVSSPS